MKIIIVGGNGTIGQAVAKELSGRHEIIIAGRSKGDVQVNITEVASIQRMYQSIGPIDAVISTLGEVHFARLQDFTEEKYLIGIRNKLLGQVNLVLTGMPYLNEGGSFTLTSGILSRDPIRMASSSAMVNGALDAFVKAAAIDLPKALRINIVSPTVLEESLPKLQSYFYGFKAVPAAEVALAYSKSVEGAQTGQVYVVG